MWRDKDKGTVAKDNEYNARLEMYMSMAYFVAKTLHIRPNEILDTWGVPELVVTYGVYSNQVAMENHEQWKTLDAQMRGKYPEMANKYNVKFIGVEQIDG